MAEEPELDIFARAGWDKGDWEAAAESFRRAILTMDVAMREFTAVFQDAISVIAEGLNEFEGAYYLNMAEESPWWQRWYWRLRYWWWKGGKEG